MPETVTVSARALIGRRAALASLVKCGSNPQCSAARRDGARRSRGDAAPRVRVGSARDSRTDRCSAADSPCRIIWRAPLRAENWRSDHTWTERTPSLRKGKARRATWRPGSRRAQVSSVGLSRPSTAACAFAPGDFIRWSQSSDPRSSASARRYRRLQPPDPCYRAASASRSSRACLRADRCWPSSAQPAGPPHPGRG